MPEETRNFNPYRSFWGYVFQNRLDQIARTVEFYLASRDYEVDPEGRYAEMGAIFLVMRQTRRMLDDIVAKIPDAKFRQKWDIFKRLYDEARKGGWTLGITPTSAAKTKMRAAMKLFLALCITANERSGKADIHFRNTSMSFKLTPQQKQNVSRWIAVLHQAALGQPPQDITTQVQAWITLANRWKAEVMQYPPLPERYEFLVEVLMDYLKDYRKIQGAQIAANELRGWLATSKTIAPMARKGYQDGYRMTLRAMKLDPKNIMTFAFQVRDRIQDILDNAQGSSLNSQDIATIKAIVQNALKAFNQWLNSQSITRRVVGGQRGGYTPYSAIYEFTEYLRWINSFIRDERTPGMGYGWKRERQKEAIAKMLMKGNQSLNRIGR